MNSNFELVRKIKENGVLQNIAIKNAMLKVDRKSFLPDEQKPFAYEDRPLPIGFDQTISQPSTVVFMLENLDLQKSQRVLDLGSGSGYTTAILSKVVGKQGYVLGIERHSQLVARSRKILRSLVPAKARIRRSYKNILGTGKEEEFDRILVSAQASSIPEVLVSQLKIGGKMVIPVQRSIIVVDKIDKKNFTTKQFNGFVFVPLIYDRLDG